MGLDEELEITVVIQLMVLGTEGGLPAEHGLLGRTRGYRSHGILFLFLRYGTQDQAKGQRKDCVFLGVLRDFGILMKTLSHYSESAKLFE